jgi:hypothetical protein
MFNRNRRSHICSLRATRRIRHFAQNARAPVEFKLPSKLKLTSSARDGACGARDGTRGEVTAHRFLSIRNMR